MTANTINKILIIGPSWVGDMVMAQSVFVELKQNNPNVVIDVLALAWTKPLLERMPQVNKAIEMPVRHGKFGWQQRKQIGKQLQLENYDQAIVLPNSWKSALIPWFAKIAIRTGWRGEMRYGLLNDIRVLDKNTLTLMVERYAALARPKAEQISTYPIPKLIAQAIDLSKWQISTEYKERLIICPGAEFGSAKQWPSQYYAELANKLIEKGWQVIILGSTADQHIADQIIHDIHHKQSCFNLAGQTELAEAIDLLDTADVVVSNDSGLMHIAAALQKNVIAIYGPTSPAFTPPLNQNAQTIQIKVECGPCFQRECPEQHHRCMLDIHPEQVLNRIEPFS
jgi:heptosyltransferase-2